MTVFRLVVQLDIDLFLLLPLAITGQICGRRRPSSVDRDAP